MNEALLDEPPPKFNDGLELQKGRNTDTKSESYINTEQTKTEKRNIAVARDFSVW